jgi:hypothetical protein
MTYETEDLKQIVARIDERTHLQQEQMVQLRREVTDMIGEMKSHCSDRNEIKPVCLAEFTRYASKASVAALVDKIDEVKKLIAFFLGSFILSALGVIWMLITHQQILK